MITILRTTEHVNIIFMSAIVKSKVTVTCSYSVYVCSAKHMQV